MTVPGNLSSPLLATAAAAAAAGDVATKSLRFNSGDSAYLNRTPSSAGNRKTFTFSCWVKLADFNKDIQTLFAASDSGSAYTDFRYMGNNSTTSRAFKLGFQHYDGSSTNALFTDIYTERLLRDPSAFYHFVLAVDFTQSTAANRVKIYINNELTNQVSSSGGSATIGQQNLDTFINKSGSGHRIGDHPNYSQNLDAMMADCYLIDGSALDPTSFGAFDDNGV